MSEPSARTSKFSKFLAKLGCTKSKGSAETIPLNDYECSNTQNFDYLNYRREWTERYTSEDQSNHGGALSDKKSDLEICGLLRRQADLSDKLKEVSCNISSEISCSDSCCYVSSDASSIFDFGQDGSQVISPLNNRIARRLPVPIKLNKVLGPQRQLWPKANKPSHTILRKRDEDDP